MVEGVHLLKAADTVKLGAFQRNIKFRKLLKARPNRLVAVKTPDDLSSRARRSSYDRRIS